MRNLLVFLRLLVLVLVVSTPVARDATPVLAGGVVGDGTPGSCTEAALTAALAGGGTVTFNCGGPKTILVTGQKTIAQDTVIQGSGAITITGGLATRLFHVQAPASLTLNDIALDSAAPVSGHGGAILSDGTLLLTNVTILQSKTASAFCGGAISTNGVTHIANSTFRGNTGDRGGAICTGTTGAARVQITNSNFPSNRAVSVTAGFGGAILMQSGQLTVTDGLLLNNSAQRGGGIYQAANTTATLTGSDSPLTFNGNSAVVGGGAIYNEVGNLTIKHASFSANSVPTDTLSGGDGGAIASTGTVAVEDTLFSLNQSRFGGAVLVSGFGAVRATIHGTTFSRNTAGGGGALAAILDATAVITVTNSAFDANSAEIGGGIARRNARLSVTRSSFTRNAATSQGGALRSIAVPSASEGGFVEIHDSTLSANSAGTGQGGGIYNEGWVNLQSVTIKDNTNGIFSARPGGGHIVRMTDTMLQNPGSLNCDGDGTLPLSAGGNFSTDNSCGLSGTGDRQGPGLDPKLGPLTKDSFGITHYHMPAADSPLVNTAVPPCSEFDQRGARRIGACDVGAVEQGGLVPQMFFPLIFR